MGVMIPEYNAALLPQRAAPAGASGHVFMATLALAAPRLPQADRLAFPARSNRPDHQRLFRRLHP